MTRRLWTMGLCAATVLATSGKGQADPPVLGMVADQVTSSVTVFDANSDMVLGSVALPQSPVTSFATGDVEILADHSLGFVTDFRFRIWVIDLRTNPPSLAGGTNPIVISTQAEDLVISNDQRFLIASDGGNVGQPVSVVDIASRTEISTLPVQINANAIDICPDNSLLVSSVTFLNTGVRRVLLGSDGSLTDTGEFLINGTNNVYCAPGGMVGLKVRGPSRLLNTFSVPGLSLIGSRTMFGGYGLCASFSPDGTRIFARSQSFGNDRSWLEAFPLNPVTGAIGTILVRRQVGAGGGPDNGPSVASGYFGMDQLATHPTRGTLYVPEGSRTPGFVVPAVRIYDPDTLNLMGEIMSQAMSRPTGIKLVARAPIEILVDIRPGSDENPVNLKSKGQLPVAVLTTDEFDALTLNVDSLRLGDPELVAVGGTPAAPSNSAVEDVDEDGDDDLLLHFDVEELVAGEALDGATVGLVLAGEALDGTLVFGGDVVTVK